MTAMRVPDPLDGQRSAPDAGGPEAPRAARRAGSARRTTSAAGQQRRSLQRDLARREASLRISRRASGPAGGLTRPQPPAAAPRAQVPATPMPVARPTAPPAPVRQAPVARQAPAPRQTPVARQAPAPRQTRQAPQARQAQPAPARQAQPRTAPQPQPRPAGVAPSTPAAVATAAVVTAPTPTTAPRPALRPFVVLTGGATEVVPGRGRRLSTSAVVLSALIAIVFTVGAIVAAQIRVTQMNEQIGSDLGRISQLQQSTVAQKERISSLVTSARIDDEAARQQLIEPDPVDVTYLSTGNRAQTAERAARALRQRPVNAIGSAAAADASDAATATTPAPTGAGTSTPAGTATSTATAITTTTQATTTP